MCATIEQSSGEGRRRRRYVLMQGEVGGVQLPPRWGWRLCVVQSG